MTFVPDPSHLLLVALARTEAPGSAAARAALILRYTPLIRKLVPSSLIDHDVRAQCHEAGKLGILRALFRFDASRGIPFGAFARKFVLGEVLAVLRDHRTTAGAEEADFRVDPDSLHVELADGDPHGAREDLRAVVRHFVASLGERDRLIVHGLFWQERSQADIARELGVTRAAVNKRLKLIYEAGRVILAPYRGEASLGARSIIPFPTTGTSFNIFNAAARAA